MHESHHYLVVFFILNPPQTPLHPYYSSPLIDFSYFYTTKLSNLLGLHGYT
jgi:hypothetical protein